MGATTVIEGIETKDDLDAAVDSVATFGQGFYFSKPIMPSEPDVTLTTEITSFFKKVKRPLKAFYDSDFDGFDVFDEDVNKEAL